MKLLLQRLEFQPNRTFGALSIDGTFQCWTLEDVVREPGAKVFGQTAIPFGEYRVALTRSERFQRVLPLLLAVPNFYGVRIHAGNTEADTEGCILVGTDRLATGIGRSRVALDGLLAKMQARPLTEPITLSIVR